MTTGPEPGWYDDGHGKQRWWDGSGWTEHFIDLGERDIELRAGAAPAGAAAGRYDDGRGRQRWWDGARWTDAARFSGTEDSFAGLVVDGRWIHFGALSQPVSGVTAASVESGAELLRRGPPRKARDGARSVRAGGPDHAPTPLAVGGRHHELRAGRGRRAAVARGRTGGTGCRGTAVRVVDQYLGAALPLPLNRQVSIWMRLDRHQAKGGFTRRRSNHEETSDGEARYDGAA